MIGIFDSGLGGLTVARNIQRFLPEYDLIYFGDTARSPYDNKSPETITGYTLDGVDFLIKAGARAVVVACHNASSVAYEKVAEKFDFPVFEIVTPAVDLAVRASKKLRIGVMGSRATTDSGIYEKKIKAMLADAKVHSRACPLLVPLTEEGWMKRPETRMIVKKCVHPLKVRQIDTLILGSTHYALLIKIIQSKIGKRVNIIDSSIAVAENLKQFLEKNPPVDDLLEKNGGSRFFVSDITDHIERLAQTLFQKNIRLEQART
jgi:glutamate racemase